MHKSLFRLSALLIALALASACSTPGKNPAGPSKTVEAVNTIDPKAMEIVTKMSAYLDKQQRLRFVIHDSIDKPDDSGFLREYNHTRVITLQRPDRLRVDVQGDLEQEKMYYNGKTVSIELPRDKAYAQTDTASTVDTMLDDMAARYDVRRPVGDLVRSGIAAAVKKNVTNAFYIGSSEVLGEQCDHLAFSGPRGDWELWVATGDKPVPKKLLVRYRQLAGAPHYEMEIESVETPATLDSTLFEFAPPAGMEKIPFQQPVAQKAGK